MHGIIIEHYNTVQYTRPLCSLPYSISGGTHAASNDTAWSEAIAV
jgi:hypothetical protein